MLLQYVPPGFTIIHGESMPNQACSHAMPGPPHSDIDDLGKRITALRERIVMMVHEEQQTRDQSELLLSLLRGLRAAKAARASDMERLSMTNGMHQPGLPMSKA
ncbi:MAG: hypothetical protein ACJ8G3_19020, partial [Burkholderiaceae bacterium]